MQHLHIPGLCLVVVAAACAGGPEPAAPAASDDDDSAASAGVDCAASASDSGWPGDDPDWTASVTLVHDGAVLGDGATLTTPTAPAGLNQDTALEFILTNRGVASLALSGDPAAWLAGEGWRVDGGVPATLDSEESARVALVFSPAEVPGASRWPATLSVPTDPPLTVTITAEVPRPLRAVAVGDGHLTLVSDDYGETWEEAAPWDGTAEEARSVAWGADRFFRAGRSGPSWGDPGTYAWSEDGATWTASTYADDFWVSGCWWGFSRFACLRASMYTWSMTGETVVHEAETWSSMLHDQVWVDDHFVAVGRDGRRAIADAVEGFTEADWLADGDAFNSVATDGERVVAVGGTDRMVVTHSDDGGWTWADAVLCSDRYARFEAVEHNAILGLWLATGDANGCARTWTSTDGATWTPHTETSHQVVVLGALRDRFVAVTSGWGQPAQLVTSADGVTWTPRTDPLDAPVRAFAVEDR